jgi:DUF1016 N-terminal domain/YhcG PDDEXK nuclease domain
MSKEINNISTDFEQIVQLIQEARNRVYAKANAELVLLYFNVGKTVSEKAAAGKWGENTVQELANFIAAKLPSLSGFNRRGLYRMKQFYETYNIGSDCFLLWLSIKDTNVSLAATQIQSIENDKDKKVSALPTLLMGNEKPSIGILLCKGKDTEVVEYAMARNTSPAIIADYETKLIDKKLLTEKLQ